LTLPSLYKKGDSEYVWAWIEPYGESDSKVRQKLGQYEYLIARSVESGQNTFVAWDNSNGLFQRCGLSIAEYHSSADLNAEFDARYDAGEIYHFYFHPIDFDWSRSNIITEHLEYIKNKKDVWYVGFGALYAYHFVESTCSIEEIEELEASLTIGEYQAPSVAYANKYFFLNATIQNLDGVADFVNATLEISNGVILKWDNATDTFSKLQDAFGYCTLDAFGSFRTTVNSTAYKLIWKIKLGWAYPEGSVSIVATNTKVFDSQGASGSGSYAGLFTFEDDLIIYSASVDDYRINPSQPITFTGTLYYQGAISPPEDTSGITVKVNLGNVLKGSTTTIDTGGTFSISLVGESNVAQHSYTIYATTNENTVQNQTVNVIVDRIRVQSYTITDERVNIYDNVNVDVLLYYDYDDTPVTDGTVTINGVSASYQGSGTWRITQSKSTVQAVTYDTVAASGNGYGIATVDQNSKSATVIWDRIQIINGGITKESVMLGETLTIWFQATYEYDNVIFDNANGVLYANNSQMSWSAVNNRWEYYYTSTTLGTKTFVISGVLDNFYGLTVIEDMVGAQTINVWSLPFSIVSNSTITGLAFNSTSKTITFTVTGPTGTTGYTNVTIAKTLIENISELTIYLDGNQIDYTFTSTEYTWLIHFTYTHSTHKVTILLSSLNTDSSSKFPLKAPAAFSGILIVIIAIILARKKFMKNT